MFTKSARFYDALYHFKDYAAASQQVHGLIQQQAPDAETLLDVACGTGQHLAWLREHYQVAGLDINPDLLTIARSRCPEIPFYAKSMVDFQLGQRFDVITCLFSSIGYVKTLTYLELAIASMARHLREGGLLIIEPWFSPTNYWRDRLTSNYVDQPDLKIAWMYVSKVEGNLSFFDIHYLVGTPQEVTQFVERHELGLFTQDEYSAAFQKAGLTVTYDAQGPFGRGLYTGVKTVKG